MKYNKEMLQKSPYKKGPSTRRFSFYRVGKMDPGLSRPKSIYRDHLYSRAFLTILTFTGVKGKYGLPM